VVITRVNDNELQCTELRNGGRRFGLARNRLKVLFQVFDPTLLGGLKQHGVELN